MSFYEATHGSVDHVFAAIRLAIHCTTQRIERAKSASCQTAEGAVDGLPHSSDMQKYIESNPLSLQDRLQ